MAAPQAYFMRLAPHGLLLTALPDYYNRPYGRCKTAVFRKHAHTTPALYRREAQRVDTHLSMFRSLHE